ncbi:MAG: DUF1631 family protein [Burkholderiaceae bacterium]|nr:DUF1631 family protein [Burkholderiaceae bacterium]
MTSTAALQRFIEDELAGMPALIEQVRRRTADGLRHAPQGSTTAAERMQRFELAKLLEAQGRRFAEAFVAALAQRVRADGAAAAAAAPPAVRGLTLLDESTHNADIEIARVATQIDSVAEWELRELQTFTSALCGLPYVSVSANPFAPEAFAHALWKAAGALGRPSEEVALLRAAGGPLADAVRHELAAACSRLEAQGVQPSLYRTAVPAQGESTSSSSLLAGLRDGVSKPQAARVDAQTRGLLKDLFDAIAQGSQMHPALRALTASLQASALDLAARDAQLLEAAEHPFWTLLDRFGFQSATHPEAADPQLRAWVGYATELVAAVQRTPLADAAGYAECVKQLDAYSAAQFNTQLQQAAADIAALGQDAPLAAPIELGTMQTVPADLLASTAAGADDAAAAGWLDAQRPGAWYRMFLRGRWGVMRLLWHNDARTRWLFASPHPQRNDGFERATLVRLRAEVLIRPLVERKIIVRAAESVRRRLADTRSTR